MPEEMWLPENKRITRAQAPTLYDAEEKCHDWLMRAARWLKKYLGHADDEFWSKSVPEAIMNVLDSHGRESSVPAAIAYLRSQGYRVEKEGDR